MNKSERQGEPALCELRDDWHNHGRVREVSLRSHASGVRLETRTVNVALPSHDARALPPIASGPSSIRRSKCEGPGDPPLFDIVVVETDCKEYGGSGRGG